MVSHIDYLQTAKHGLRLAEWTGPTQATVPNGLFNAVGKLHEGVGLVGDRNLPDNMHGLRA